MSSVRARSWLTLLEKGIAHHSVVVNLLAGDKAHVVTLPSRSTRRAGARVRSWACPASRTASSYESAAITEWLDEQFPFEAAVPIAESTLRAEVKMWQYWELASSRRRSAARRRRRRRRVLCRAPARPRAADAGPWRRGPTTGPTATPSTPPVQDLRRELPHARAGEALGSSAFFVRGFAMLRGSLSDGRDWPSAAAFSQADVASYRAARQGAAERHPRDGGAGPGVFPRAMGRFGRRLDRSERLQRLPLPQTGSSALGHGSDASSSGGVTGWCVPWARMILGRHVQAGTRPRARDDARASMYVAARAIVSGERLRRRSRLRGAAAGSALEYMPPRAGEVAIPRRPPTSRARSTMLGRPRGGGGSGF